MFEEILSRRKEGILGYNRAKLAVLMVQLMEASITAYDFPRRKTLWYTERKIEQTKELGLGIKESLEKYGYG